MERKKFIRMVALGAPAMALGLQGCGTAYFAQYTFADRRFIIPRAEFTDRKRGVPVPRKFILIIHEGLPFPVCIYDRGEKGYTALYLRCTHRGCEVKPRDGYLVCPCHGSEFSNTGEVTHPPAEQNLQQFEVFTDDENIYVKL